MILLLIGLAILLVLLYLVPRWIARAFENADTRRGIVDARPPASAPPRTQESDR